MERSVYGISLSLHVSRGSPRPITPAVPHNISICFWFDEVAYFYFVIDEKPKRLTGTGLKRMRNIAGNPRVALIIDHYEEEWTKGLQLADRVPGR